MTEEILLRYENLDSSKLTPMMRQYLGEKQKRPDCLLFFRLGDFFELFFDDAITVSKELGLTLTRRDCGQETKAPMCGVPHHAADSYIARLVEHGYKVAICEQVEDPAAAQGIVDRSVIRVVTPGTITDPESLDALKYHYIVCVYQSGHYYGLAMADISASRFACTEILYGATASKLLDELQRIAPAEIVGNREFYHSEACHHFVRENHTSLSLQDDKIFERESCERFREYCDHDGSLKAKACCGLLAYIEASAFQLPEQMSKIPSYQVETYMILNQTARRHLEIVETIRERQRRGSLLWSLDHCRTGMGSRMLRRWLDQPLLNLDDIRKRQDAIEAFMKNFIERNEIREALAGLYDLERLSGKLALQSANPRDLAGIAFILERIPLIQARLNKIPSHVLQELSHSLDDLQELTDTLKRELADELPVQIHEGGIFRDGAYAELDELREASKNGKQWLLSYEQEEREKSGIKSLKVKYNRVFGYAIEITKSYLSQVPDHYIRKQTLSNSERFLTEELKEMENRIIGAEQKMLGLEAELFQRLRERAAVFLPQLRRNAELLACLDALSTLSELAESRRYVRPVMREEPVLHIQGGRHPVVEAMMKEGQFVPNDLKLDAGSEQRLMILTGPNMAGKSTYMRQNALIVLMAQAGMFVPADQAEIGICDQIFTRVGASDDLASGQSTFMIEMMEVAQIMREAGPRSLLILDEIGRGTSTWDGLSIAWSVIEHAADPKYLGCRCLFATHYHELTELEGSIQGVFNAHVEVAEENKSIIFLHRISSGGSDNSYGIEVARLAGVPDSLIHKAEGILRMLEKENNGKRLQIRKASQPLEGQIDLFSAAREWQQSDRILEEILSVEINEIRPLDALAILSDLQNRARKILPERSGQRKTGVIQRD